MLQFIRPYAPDLDRLVPRLRPVDGQLRRQRPLRAHLADLQRLPVHRQPGRRHADRARARRPPGRPAERQDQALPGRRDAGRDRRLHPLRPRGLGLRSEPRPARPMMRVRLLGVDRRPRRRRPRAGRLRHGRRRRPQGRLQGPRDLLERLHGHRGRGRQDRRRQGRQDLRRSRSPRTTRPRSSCASPSRASRTSARDANCTIRPQSLIGERYVECTPTQPQGRGGRAGARAEGDQGRRRQGPVPAARLPDDQAGRHRPGQQHHAAALPPAAVDHHQRAGHRSGGNGGELRQAISKANPALEQTDKVLAILAEQNETLAQLAKNGDEVLAPAGARQGQGRRLRRPGRQDRGRLGRAPQRHRGVAAEVPGVPAAAHADDGAPGRPGRPDDAGARRPQLGRPADQPVHQAARAVQRGGHAGAEVAGRRRRRRRPGADQGQADRRRRRDVRQAGQAADQQPRGAADVPEDHGRHRAPDGLPVLPGRGDQRL